MELELPDGTHRERSAKSLLTQEMRRKAGKWLASHREAAGVTQGQLAQQIGYRYYTFVAQMEGGFGRVPAEHFALWAACIGIPEHQFAREMLRFYEPDYFRLLFPDEPALPN